MRAFWPFFGKRVRSVHSNGAMAAVDLNALFAPSNPLNVIKKAFEQEHTRFVKAMKKKNTAKNSEDGNSKW